MRKYAAPATSLYDGRFARWALISTLSNKRAILWGSRYDAQANNQRRLYYPKFCVIVKLIHSTMPSRRRCFDLFIAAKRLEPAAFAYKMSLRRCIRQANFFAVKYMFLYFSHYIDVFAALI